MARVSEEHPELFHYTDYDGLKGIIQNQALRASHYRCLNDSEEIVCFKKALKNFSIPLLIKTLEDLEKEGVFSEQTYQGASLIGTRHAGASVAFDEVATILYEALLGKKFAEPYIASFCATHKGVYEEKNGLLSQWNRYAGNGGYALIFDADKLEKLMDEEAIRFAYLHLELGDVIYSGNEKDLLKEFSEELKELGRFVCALVQGRARNEKCKEISEAAFRSFLKCISRYKHEGFKEEKEVRLVAFLLNKATHQKFVLNPDKPLREIKSFIRPRDGKEVRCIEMMRWDKDTSPIKRVMVGPSADKEKRAAELRKLYPELQVDVSETPFV